MRTQSSPQSPLPYPTLAAQGTTFDPRRHILPTPHSVASQMPVYRPNGPPIGVSPNAYPNPMNNGQPIFYPQMAHPQMGPVAHSVPTRFIGGAPIWNGGYGPLQYGQPTFMPMNYPPFYPVGHQAEAGGSDDYFSPQLIDEKVYCVICQSEYSSYDREEHLKKHQRGSKTQTKINKVAQYQFNEGPITRPIVEPEEFNIQYDPNKYIIEQEQRYKTLQPPIHGGDAPNRSQNLGPIHEDPGEYEDRRNINQQNGHLSTDQYDPARGSHQNGYQETGILQPGLNDRSRFSRDTYNVDEASEPNRNTTSNVRESFIPLGDNTARRLVEEERNSNYDPNPNYLQVQNSGPSSNVDRNTQRSYQDQGLNQSRQSQSFRQPEPSIQQSARQAYSIDQNSGYRQQSGYQRESGYQQQSGYRQPSGTQQSGYRQPSGYQQQSGYRQPSGTQQSGYRQPSGYQQQSGYRPDSFSYRGDGELRQSTGNEQISFDQILQQHGVATQKYQSRSEDKLDIVEPKTKRVSQSGASGSSWANV